MGGEGEDLRSSFLPGMQPGGDRRQGTMNKVCEGKRGPGWDRGRLCREATGKQGIREALCDKRRWEALKDGFAEEGLSRGRIVAGHHPDPVQVIPLRRPKTRAALVSRSSSQSPSNARGSSVGLPPSSLNSEPSENADLSGVTLRAVPGFPGVRGGQEGQV